ncbi:unnamed protein product [Heligmosomoides polygyrus]|uniref:Uncharacterized protein n=1 Tax=Heligmosomoides polygyrus TaxID=6339 RepID=A0A183G841_HELPZ|nr:unnamed protein product [Heligmosomoides polygyrus]
MELKLGAFFRSSSSSEDDHLEGCTCDGDLDYNEASPRGFGLLESGRVSPKDEVNVMVKNVVDVIFGGK